MVLDRFGEIPIFPGDRNRADVDGASDNDTERPVSDREEVTDDRKTYSPDPASIPVAESPGSGYGGGQSPPPSSPFLSLAIRWGRWLGIPVAVVVLYGLVFYFLVPSLIRKSLLPVLSRQLSRPVTVNRIIFSPFTLRLYLSRISVGSVDGDKTSNQALLSMSALECRVGLSRVFDGKLLCEQAVMRDVTARLKYSPEEKVDLVDISALFLPGTLARGERLWPAWLEVGELTLTGGTLIVDDLNSSRRYQVDDIELFLPGIKKGDDGSERLPKLSAVVNESPVQAEAVRIFDREGRASTGLDLHVTDVDLAPFLEKFPLTISDLYLVDGVGDFDFRIVLPAEQENAQPVTLSGDAYIRSIRVNDGRGLPVLLIPETRFGFTVTPGSETLQLRGGNIVEPEINIYTPTSAQGDKPDPLPLLAEIASAAVHGSAHLAVDEFRVVNGTVRFLRSNSPEPEMLWRDVALQVKSFATPGYVAQIQMPDGDSPRPEPGYLVLEFSDGAGPGTTKVMLEGRIHPGQGVSGRLSATMLDFKRYGAYLAWSGHIFDKGVGDVRFTYDYAPGRPGTGAGSSFLLGDGYLSINDFRLRKENGNVGLAGGRSLICEGMQAAPSSRHLSCRTLSVTGGDFFSDFGKVAGKDWKVAADELHISDSRLRSNITRAVCPQLRDLVLENFNVAELEGAGVGLDRRRVMTATVGTKGTVRLVTDAGGNKKQSRQVQIDLQGLDFRIFSPCLATVLRPGVRQGKFNATGTYDPASKRFTGTVLLEDFVAGRSNGTYVSLARAESSDVTLDLANRKVMLKEVAVTRPVIKPGLVDSENPLDNFIVADQDPYSNFSLDLIRIEEGTFHLPWPVILPGYQPVLTDLAGAMSHPGRDGAVFDLKGMVEKAGSFSLKGLANRKRVLSYLLKVENMRFDIFSSFPDRNTGISGKDVKGRWQQERVYRDTTVETVNRLEISGISPQPSSRFFMPLALMLDDTANLSVEMRESTFAGQPPSFLLDRFVKYLEYQAVRADISPYLLLQEELPGLKLSQEVFFEAGSSDPAKTESLGDYQKLLERRPLLGIVLRAWIDDADRESLRLILQREADQARKEENLKRERLRRLERESLRKKLDDVKAGKSGIVIEELDESELDLAPLPPVQVEVTPAMLEQLAGERLESVRRYLLQGVGISPEKIRVDDEFGRGRPRVTLVIEPLVRQVASGDEDNGTAETD